MKRISVVIILLLFCLTGMYAQTQWGVKGGLSMVNFAEGETDLKPSFHAGVILQHMITGSFGIESGLYYSGAGAYKTMDLVNYQNEKIGTEEKSVRLDYIQIPVRFLLKFKVANDISLCPSIGGYVSHGTGGKVTTEGESDYSYEESHNFFNSGATSKLLDAGVGAGVSLEFEDFFTRSAYGKQTNKIILGVSYDRGLMKVNTDDGAFAGTDFYNQAFKLSLGFLF